MQVPTPNFGGRDLQGVGRETWCQDFFLQSIPCAQTFQFFPSACGDFPKPHLTVAISVLAVIVDVACTAPSAPLAGHAGHMCRVYTSVVERPCRTRIAQAWAQDFFSLHVGTPSGGCSVCHPELFGVQHGMLTLQVYGLTCHLRE